MKKTLLLLLTAICLLSLFACAKKPVIVVKDTEEFIVITPELKEGETFTLLSYMEKLRSENLLTYETEGTMVTAVNGIKNANDHYWMLYTSDADYSNKAWGTAVYKEETYGSAVVGAGELPLKKGCIYIWIYQGF